MPPCEVERKRGGRKRRGNKIKVPTTTYNGRPLWQRRLGLKRFVSKSIAVQRIKHLAGLDGRGIIIKRCPECKEWEYIDVAEKDGRWPAEELPEVIEQLKKKFPYLVAISHGVFPAVSSRYCNACGEAEYEKIK